MEDISLESTKMIIGGGINFSGAILNAIKSCVSTIMDVGRAVGSAIRRINSGKLCSF